MSFWHTFFCPVTFIRLVSAISNILRKITNGYHLRSELLHESLAVTKTVRNQINSNNQHPCIPYENALVGMSSEHISTVIPSSEHFTKNANFKQL